MAISVEAILADARRLVVRLKEHDSSADCLIARTQSLQKQLDAMKQVNIQYICCSVILHLQHLACGAVKNQKDIVACPYDKDDCKKLKKQIGYGSS